MARRLGSGGLALLLSLLFGMGALKASTTEMIISDPRSGTALYGIDPVSYFIEGKPQEGRDDYELRFGGLVWRFASAANRAAFEASPALYVPEFGGYDPLAIEEGYPVPGNPALFAIEGDKLFLFSSAEHRQRFLANAPARTKAARAQWEEVKKKLVP